MKQEIVSGSGISWAIYKSALPSRQTTTPALHHSVFYRPDALPATQPTVSKQIQSKYEYSKAVHKGVTQETRSQSLTSFCVLCIEVHV